MAKAQKEDAAGPSVPVELPAIRVGKRPFTYTSPSALPPRSAAERRARGCEEETYHTKKGPKTKFTGRLKSGKPSTYCKTTSKPCGERSSCPVQLVWLDGLPHLRFCSTPGAPGHLVQVDNARDAQALAAEACQEWPNPKKKVKWPPKYFEKKAPGVVERARRERPDSPWGTPGLGDAEAPRRRSLAAALPFVAVGAFAAWLFTPPKTPATPPAP